tara:strand:- start:2386 stop:5292 length:2907 start_codon:yes stop_codon:yes gene_type:complete
VKQDKQQGDNVRTSYKETLNLLKTDFGMRANSSIREPELQSFWKQKGIDLELGIANQGPSFTLHDGPPYANGDLHMGHALNKVLKDIINKFQIMKGRQVRFVPGWDCHGLPIELKVLQNLDANQREQLTPLKLRKKAAAYARKQVNNQMAGFKRWGIWADWDHPYLTLDKDYEAAQIKLFGEMVLKGYIYRGLKPVHWSPSSRTALAEAELEYPEGHISPSIYVGFQITELPKDLINNLIQQGLEIFDENQQLLMPIKAAVWTTTPWTIPANLAIGVNQRLEYSFAADDRNQLILVASELLSDVADKIGTKLISKAKVKGSLLEGTIYSHPLLDRYSQIVIGGDYISTDSGTGLVHTAPGHGVDDFNTGIKYNLPILCPVDEKGYLTEEAGRFKGLNVLKDANSEIINSLKEAEALIKEVSYEHRYPYDWRTKKPTIFRATEQWFASVEGFRNQALESIDKVDWLPETGRNRITSMVKERGDWCISRQRTWGVPIPVFYEREGDKVLLNEETLAHIYKIFSEHGADIWWEKDEEYLLPTSYVKDASKWKKGTDTMDVWFDSGSSWKAVSSKRKGLNYPADLYLEGSDQHRGWFQSSLLTSTAVNNQPPYKCVLTHGFALDENGRKMSKSLGNIIDPSIIINGGPNKKENPAFGADVLRLWVSSVDYSVDVPIGSNILRQLSDVYRKVRNTSRYLLGNIHDFDPAVDGITIEKLPLLDKWMLHRTGQIIDEITQAFEKYEFSRFFQLIQNYCVSDLSSFYLDIAKDRLYVSGASDKRRRSCQTVMSLIIERIAGLIAPVLPHMAEDIWLNIPYQTENDSVFKNGWPDTPRNWIDESLNQPIKDLRNFMNDVNKTLEDCRSKNHLGSSLDADVRVEIKKETLQNSFEWLSNNGDIDVDSLRDWLLVSNLQIGGEPWAEILISQETENGIIEISKARGIKCSRCWHYTNDIGLHPEYKDICGRCIDVLNRL